MSLENIVANLELDVYDHDSGQPTIKAIALDDNTRYAAAMVRYKGEPYNVGQNATVELIIIRPDKVGVITAGSAYELPYDDPSTEEIEVIYGVYAELDQAAIAVSGELLGQFRITSGGQILRTQTFKIKNGKALDEGQSDWAGEYEGHNLDEMAAAIDSIRTATPSDVGKYLRASAVVDGKVTSWQFSTPSGGGGEGDGQDGFSPIVAVTDITGGHRVSITDVDGTKTFDVMDGTNGTNGTNGANGFSPTVTVTNITGGHRVSITDATGTQTFDVMDGTVGSGGYSLWSSKKVCIFGDSIGYGYNNNAHSFVDILRERGFFASVHKNCVSGSTTATWTARLQESSTEIADADIIYAEYEANDIVGLKGGSLTTDALVSTVRNCASGIRNVNPTCTIIWMPLTIQHLSKIAGTDLSYYQSWANAMYPVFAELGINLLPIFDTLNANHASSDGRHPNDAGHEAIADLVMQMPLGTSNYPTALS